MGRITLFTADHCTFSLRVKHELETRGLPYEEISLTRHPDRREDLFGLSRSYTTPQAFFNTRHIGGYDTTLQELKSWDKDKQFKNALEKYKSQIAKYPSPSNPKLALVDENATTSVDLSSLALVNERKTVQLNLPSGVKIYSVWELTSLLTSILPLSSLHYHLMTYKKSVTGAQATSALAKHFDCTREEAESIGRDLHAIGLLHHVTYANPFSDTSKFYYRLQYHQTPHIINTLYLCDGEDAIGDDDVKANALVKRVECMLETITKSCLDPDKKNGGIRYKQGATHALFGELQETLCCFQSVDISHMESQALLAFGLNIYNIMLQFAFFKLGIPGKEAHQQSFLQGVKFNIGGRDYSFNEWLGIISEGNVGVEPNIRDSPRRSLLVPKRPSTSPIVPVPLGVGTNTTDNSESQSSSDTPTNGQNSLRKSTKQLRSRRSSANDSSSRSDTRELSPANFRIYFATHFFWSRASAMIHFTAENVDKELTILAFAFCENDDNVRVDAKKGELHLSHIFSAYRKHFGATALSRGDSMSDSYTSTGANDVDLAKIVYNFAESNKRLQLQKVLPSSGAKTQFKIRFHEDNWTTNAAKNEFVEFKPSLIDANCARF